MKSSKRIEPRTERHDGPCTEMDYQQAATFDMPRFDLTLPEATNLVKNKQYPGSLKTIEGWRVQHSWPAASSELSREYVLDLIKIQRSRRR